ncbi:unnamed protein product [Peniophora sp. CBMAI 1063]|nr:unnamed protein product [Peniophora sp. CBMAI 1063]
MPRAVISWRKLIPKSSKTTSDPASIEVPESSPATPSKTGSKVPSQDERSSRHEATVAVDSFLTSTNDSPTLDKLTGAHAIAELWRQAFHRYKEVTGIDLEDENLDLYRRLKDYSDSGDIVHVLARTAEEFGVYRHPSADDVQSRIRGALKPIVRAFLSMGVLEAGGELAAALPTHVGKAPFVAIIVLFRATQGVSARFDAVVQLLRKYENYTRRLYIFVAVPVGSESHRIILDILVEMIHTLALVTQMMSKSRTNHFFSALIGRGDEVMDAARRLEAFEVQDTRLILVTIYKEVCLLSGTLRDALHRLEISVAGLNDRMDDVSQGIAEISTNVRTAVDTVSMMYSVVGAASKQDSPRRTTDSGRIASTSATRLESQTDEIGLFAIWSLCIATTYRHAISTPGNLTSRVLSEFDYLPSNVRAALKQGLALLYSITAFATFGTLDTSTAVAATNPATFASAFVPLAMAYAAAFLYGLYLPRPLGHSRLHTFILIDILGHPAEIPLGMYTSWNDVHALLLKRFMHQPGARYVESRAYIIMDTAHGSTAISPTSWMQSVRAGMILEMSIVVRQQSRKCPYCECESERLIDDAILIDCQGCQRLYRSSTTFVGVESDPMLSPSGRSWDGEGLDVATKSILDAADDPPAEEDMTLFRRIAVEILRRVPQNLFSEAKDTLHPDGTTLNMNAGPSSYDPITVHSSLYKCEYCGKGFTRPSSLKIHIHNHTGERPYKCTFGGCERVFSVHSNMCRHARTHQHPNAADVQVTSEDDQDEGEDSPTASGIGRGRYDSSSGQSSN